MPKTEITAKQLYENRNTSDVFSRLVIMGVLRVLNQKLRYTQVWEDTKEGTQEITVPFFFDFTGGAGTSEKFIQDNYMNWTDDECTSMGIKKVNGDYKPTPYGVISLDSTNIESGNISNRFVMGQFQKRINGELKPYVACLYSIPLTMSFTVNIACDTVNTMWKIEQAYREFFYKNKTFHINYKGTVVPCRIGFPESLTENKTANYTMGAQQKDGADVKLSFSLNCETYQPVFDPYTEMPADRNIKNFQGGITLQEKSSLTTDKYGEKQIIKERVIDENGYIEAEHIDRLNVVALEDILLKWNFFYNYSDLLHVDILYKEYGDEEYHTILNNIDNHNFCHMSISGEFVNEPEIDVIIPQDDDVMILGQPVFKFYLTPDNTITSDTCVVIDKGQFLFSQQAERCKIDAILSFEVGGKIKEYPIKINLLNGAVDTENPVEMNCIVYPKEFDARKIQLFVRDHDRPDIIAAFQDEDEFVKVF